MIYIELSTLLNNNKKVEQFPELTFFCLTSNTMLNNFRTIIFCTSSGARFAGRITKIHYIVVKSDLKKSWICRTLEPNLASLEQTKIQLLDSLTHSLHSLTVLKYLTHSLC